MDAQQLIEQARQAGRGWLHEADGKRLLACFGVDVQPLAGATGPAAPPARPLRGPGFGAGAAGAQEWSPWAPHGPPRHEPDARS